MTTADKVKVIAVYDGWNYYEPTKEYPNGFFQLNNDPEDLHEPYYTHDDLLYLTQLNNLHPVALDVLEKVVQFYDDCRIEPEVTESRRISHRLQAALFFHAVNGEYIDLFNAVYDGIDFINKQKK